MDLYIYYCDICQKDTLHTGRIFSLGAECVWKTHGMGYWGLICYRIREDIKYLFWYLYRKLTKHREKKVFVLMTAGDDRVRGSIQQGG